jgi:hypothetical protein
LNIIFHPPFKQANFSSTIKVHLFEGNPDASILPKYVDESILQLVNNTFTHTNIAVAGFYSFGLGFFIDLDANNNAVYTIFTMESKTHLVKIADSLSIFYEMLVKTLAIWQTHILDDHLQKTQLTLNKEQDLINYFENRSPGSSPIFWQLYFFGDLHIGLE